MAHHRGCEKTRHAFAESDAGNNWTQTGCAERFRRHTCGSSPLMNSGNDLKWIADAMLRALVKYQEYDLDVYMVERPDYKGKTILNTIVDHVNAGLQKLNMSNMRDPESSDEELAGTCVTKTDEELAWAPPVDASEGSLSFVCVVSALSSGSRAREVIPEAQSRRSRPFSQGNLGERSRKEICEAKTSGTATGTLPGFRAGVENSCACRSTTPAEGLLILCGGSKIRFAAGKPMVVKGLLSGPRQSVNRHPAVEGAAESAAVHEWEEAICERRRFVCHGFGRRGAPQKNKDPKAINEGITDPAKVKSGRGFFGRSSVPQDRVIVAVETKST